MSITIGSIYTGAQNSFQSGTNGPSKLNLYSPTDSRLVILRSGIQDVFVQMDKFAFGRCNTFFHITDTDSSNILVQFATGSNQLRYPTIFQSSVTISSNLSVINSMNVGSNIGTVGITASNIAILTAGTGANTILSAYNNEIHSNLFILNADGTSHMKGPVAIGATSTIQSGYALTINGSVIATGANIISSSNIKTQVVTATDGTASLEFGGNSIKVNGQFDVDSLRLSSNQTFSTMTLDRFVQTPQLVITGMTPNTGVPVYLVQNNTCNYPQDNISILLTPPSSLRFISDSNLSSNYNQASNVYSTLTSNYYNALSMNNTGMIGIGTGSPRSILDISADYSYYVNSNIPVVSVRSPYTSNSIVVSYHNYLGIGTSVPESELHIVRANINPYVSSGSNLPPLITLNNGAHSNADLLYGLSNGVRVIGISSTGAIAVGPVATSNMAARGLPSTYLVDVDTAARFSNVETRFLTGINNLLTVATGTTLAVPTQLNGNSATMATLFSTDISSCNLIACNLTVPLLNTDIPNQRINLLSSNALFIGTQLCISSNAASIDTDINTITTAGKVKIVVPAPPVSLTNYPVAGLAVYGAQRISTLLRSSTTQAYYEVQGNAGGQNIIGRYGMDESGILTIATRSSLPSDPSYLINRVAPIITMNTTDTTYNQIVMNNYVSVTSKLFGDPNRGGLGVGVYRGPTTVATQQYNLDVLGGTVGVRPDTGYPSVNTSLITFYVDANAGRVGIGTTSVANSLSVVGAVSIGSAAFANTTAPANSLIVSGNVGIGTASTSTDRLRVQGNARISTGGLYFDNNQQIYGKNTAGDDRPFLIPRGDDNISYIYYGSAGFDIRNNTGASRIFVTDTAKIGMGAISGTPTEALHVFGNILATGTITSQSDSNVKKDILPITNALGKVSALTGYTFVMRDDPTEKRLTGLLAQEVRHVLPEAVSADNNNTLSLAYGNMVGLLIEAIKDLKNKNEALEARVAALEQHHV